MHGAPGRGRLPSLGGRRHVRRAASRLYASRSEKRNRHLPTLSYLRSLSPSRQVQAHEGASHVPSVQRRTRAEGSNRGQRGGNARKNFEPGGSWELPSGSDPTGHDGKRRSTQEASPVSTRP
ncbi:Hypothetical protein A7982_09773 [Minicystis rosea]|nr:Hypothetical protein A7982_09773 [Minicystis rosea]